MSAMAYVTITPLGASESVSQYVAKVIKIIKESGVVHELTDMGTIIEADTPEEIFELVNKAQTALEGCNRILISVNMDYRKDRKEGMKQKVASVLKHL